MYSEHISTTRNCFNKTLILTPLHHVTSHPEAYLMPPIPQTASQYSLNVAIYIVIAYLSY